VNFVVPIYIFSVYTIFLSAHTHTHTHTHTQRHTNTQHTHMYTLKNTLHWGIKTVKF
jgi:hypothetical protein